MASVSIACFISFVFYECGSLVFFVQSFIYVVLCGQLDVPCSALNVSE